MSDKTITCKDCGNDFVFTVGEQEFYQEKGFENEPVRCPECRRARKANRNQYRNNRNSNSDFFSGNRAA
ncbi:MAG: zinc-ribbon domain-containing protein [Bacilli bacterium]|jgi:ssDNA-binding Zn-finger/Zn-ribbon topoisomerase 1|nr:zinc-ribbon domain-containing protein [Bacilli bacterium]